MLSKQLHLNKKISRLFYSKKTKQHLTVTQTTFSCSNVRIKYDQYAPMIRLGYQLSPVTSIYINYYIQFTLASVNSKRLCRAFKLMMRDVFKP